MADITKLARVTGKGVRDYNLTENTLVSDNVKLLLGSGNASIHATLTGSLTAARTVTMPDANVNLGHISALVSLSGVAGGDTDLGTFTGTTIADNSTIKAALQALETAVETALSIDAHLQGGQAYGQTAIIGSTDNENVSIIRNNVQRMLIDSGSVKAFNPFEVLTSDYLSVFTINVDGSFKSAWLSTDLPSSQIIEFGAFTSEGSGGAAQFVGPRVKSGTVGDGTYTAGSANIRTFAESGFSEATNVAVNSGAINIFTGDAFAQGTLTDANSGSIEIFTGTAEGAGQRGIISLDGRHIDVNSNQIKNLADPTASQDAATKAYVDAVAEGFRPKTAVRAATTAAGTLATDFENGDTLDGITLNTNDRILIKNQSTASENGIYVVQASGAPVRAADFDSLSPIDEINGAMVAVQEGTANAGKIFVQSGPVTSIGVDNINFVFFNSVSGLVGGDGITVSGSNISVDHDGEGLTFSAGQLALELDGATLSKSGAGLKLSDTSVSAGSYGSPSQVGSFTVDAQGRLTAASNTNIDHDALTNFVANEHVDHSAVSIATAAGTSGLTGGGDITATRNLSVDINGTTAETSTDNADKILIWDDSASALKSMTRANFLSGLQTTVEKVETLADAGESLTAGVRALRWAQGAETAGRLYRADNDASSVDNFYVAALYVATGTETAGTPLTTVKSGKLTATAHGFTVGAPIFLGATGALTNTAPTATDTAVVRVGIARDANTIDVDIQVIGIN